MDFSAEKFALHCTLLHFTCEQVLQQALPEFRSHLLQNWTSDFTAIAVLKNLALLRRSRPLQISALITPLAVEKSENTKFVFISE